MGQVEYSPQVKVMNHLAVIVQSVARYLLTSLSLPIYSNNHVRQSLK